MAIGQTNTASDLLKLIYPIGSVYINTKSETLPSILSSIGTWKRIDGGKFLLAATTNGTYRLGATGGEETHQLTISEMPKHRHHSDTLTTFPKAVNGGGSGWSGFVGDSGTEERYEGGDSYHNNMPPYQCVAMWERTA